MKISVVIDTYNSEAFITEAIQSVLKQTRQPDELIIVDDGSTDRTTEKIKNAIIEITWARLIKKENGGQLSCITTGILEAEGDLIAILDGDDLWKPSHIKEAEEKFQDYPEISLYFCDYVTLGADHIGAVMKFPDTLFQSTFAVTALSEAFIGNVTSTLVFKADSLKPYLPLPTMLERQWKINADNVLVWLSCMTGVQKYSSSRKNIIYRVHENNMHKSSGKLLFKANKRLATKKLFEYFRREFYIPENIYQCLIREYKAHDKECKRIKKMYFKAIKCSAPQSSFWERLLMRWQLF